MTSHTLNCTPVNGIKGVIVPPILCHAIVPKGISMVFPMDVLTGVRCDPFVTNSEHSPRTREWGGKGRWEVRPSAMAEHYRGCFLLSDRIQYLFALVNLTVDGWVGWRVWKL